MAVMVSTLLVRSLGTRGLKIYHARLERSAKDPSQSFYHRLFAMANRARKR